MAVYIDATKLRDQLAADIVGISAKITQRQETDKHNSSWSYTIRDAAVAESLGHVVRALDVLIAEGNE